MTVKFGFYNSVGGDRTYNAEDMSQLFDGIITDGVFEDIGDALRVTPTTGVDMDVAVGQGKAWFDHTWTINDAALVFTIDDAHLTLDRIDLVILEVDASDAVRANTIKVLTGTPASVPVEPTLTNTSEVHQYPIARIDISSGVTAITLLDITDYVGSYLFPYITVPQAGTAGGAAVLEVQVFS